MLQLRNISRLHWRNQLLLVQAGLVVVAVRLMLWLPYRLWQGQLRLTERTAKGSRPRNAPPVEWIAWAVARTSRFVPGATCLTQALTTQWLLGAYGYSSTLRIGVSRNLAQMEAHAWVEHDGRVIIGGTGDWLARFAVRPVLRGEFKGVQAVAS